MKLMCLLTERAFLNLHAATCYYRSEQLENLEEESRVLLNRAWKKFGYYRTVMDSRRKRAIRYLKDFFTLQIFMKEKESPQYLDYIEKD